MQQLADIKDFYVHGIAENRLPEWVEEETVNAWLQAASDTVLRAFASFAVLPLTEWGQDVRQWTAIIAAWQAKQVIGMDASEYEYEALKERYDQVMKELELIRLRKEAPVGVVDSSATTAEEYEEGFGAPVVKGYDTVALDYY